MITSWTYRKHITYVWRLCYIFERKSVIVIAVFYIRKQLSKVQTMQTFWMWEVLGGLSVAFANIVKSDGSLLNQIGLYKAFIISAIIYHFLITVYICFKMLCVMSEIVLRLHSYSHRSYCLKLILQWPFFLFLFLVLFVL